jgi:hypothetical protein
VNAAKKENNMKTRSCVLIFTVMVVMYVCATFFGNSFAKQQRSPKSELEEANKLAQQVIDLYQQSRYMDAISLAEKVLAIRKKLLGPEPSGCGDQSQQLGSVVR